MASPEQNAAARRNSKKAVAPSAAKRSGRSHATPKRQSAGELSSAERRGLKSTAFAFPRERKEPLSDADHVRNAVARFDQVEDVSDAERDAAWRRIRAAARKFGVKIEARGWRSLMNGGNRGSD